MKPPTESSTVALLARFQHLVQQNSHRWQMVILLEALGLAVAAPLAYLWLVFFLDNQWHLPLLGRLLASLGFLAGVGWAGLHFVRRWRAIQLTEDQVALAIERGTPGGVDNRLINALQLARIENAQQELSAAVVMENCRRLQQMHLEQASQLRPALLRLGLAGMLVCVGVGFWLFSPEQFLNAASRIFLPLAEIDPLYRTRLKVEQGKLLPGGEVTITVAIEGERPRQLIVFKNVNGKRTTENVTVPQEQDGPVAFTFREVTQDLEYSVRGGDYTTPLFQIDVPRQASLARVHITYQYPAYTGLAPKSVESQTGDLEALQNTVAQVTFVFNQPVDSAALILEQPASLKDAGQPQPLKQLSPKEFAGEIALSNLLGYRLQTVQGKQSPELGGSHAVRILKDQEPKLELIGLERRTEVLVDSVLPLQMVVGDDYGLERIGLFYRRVINPAPKTSPADDGWKQIIVWPGEKKTSFRHSHDLVIAGLAAEGDKLEVALRAVDTDPLRKGAWTTGVVHELTVGGDGVALQLQYEQIMQTEKDLKKLLLGEQESLNQTVFWMRKLDSGSDVRWDDPKNIDLLHNAASSMDKDQAGARQHIAKIVRNMPPQTGNLRIGLEMLADSEMDRLQRTYKAVPSRAKPQDKRAALADGRVTQERIIRSLEEMLEQYQGFRSNWELNNMIPFTKMLADRQTKLRDQSRKVASIPLGKGPATKAEEFARQSMHRRQLKMLDLSKLIQPAFPGLATRLEDDEPGLARAFQSGGSILASDVLQKPLAQAAQDAKAGRWSETVKQQTQAADQLTNLYEMLRKAQVEAAQKALALLKEKMKSDLDTQKELEKLPPGTAEMFLKELPDKIKLEDLMRIQEITGAKKRKDDGVQEEPDLKSIPLVDVDRKQIERETDSGVYQDPYTLKLGNVPEKTAFLKLPKDQKENAVKPFIQDKFDDLVGKLLDETEELHKNYQTLKLSTNQNNNDPGEIGKIGGTLNSTGAVTATGNKKPPTMDSGGLSRTGRQGARSHGMVADDEGVDRRGRDKALDGQEQVADQAGAIKMKKSDDMQKDTSTGVGGKKVESDDTHFSLHDAGKWKDEYTKRMEKPQKKQYIVERQGDKIDAKTAALLRDLTSKQEQVIERLKAIKKELRNLYLPTEHLDELAAALESNLTSLKEQPDPELFRQQIQTLDKLRGAMRVFRGVNSGFQASLPRARVIQGRVLDEPAAQAIPGYEEAVRQYYSKLANQ